MLIAALVAKSNHLETTTSSTKTTICGYRQTHTIISLFNCNHFARLSTYFDCLSMYIYISIYVCICMYIYVIRKFELVKSRPVGFINR